MGNGTSYNPTMVWTPSGAIHVYHMNKPTTLVDSAGITNMTNVSTCVEGADIGLGKSVQFYGDCGFYHSGYAQTATGTGASTELVFIKASSVQNDKITISYGNAAGGQLRSLWPSHSSSGMFYMGYTGGYDFQSSLIPPTGSLAIYGMSYNSTHKKLIANNQSQTGAYSVGTGSSFMSFGYSYRAVTGK